MLLEAALFCAWNVRKVVCLRGNVAGVDEDTPILVSGMVATPISKVKILAWRESVCGWFSLPWMTFTNSTLCDLAKLLEAEEVGEGILPKSSIVKENIHTNEASSEAL